ncbi:hypothetical protein GW17_00055594 [Ensete ventricosum]|nr:hypothetical protein GW17_00055594 [Ensete ventricosum]RZS29350.1 hypothetical protein BHM03_00063065 [Ensete ventricosum]
MTRESMKLNLGTTLSLLHRVHDYGEREDSAKVKPPTFYTEFTIRWRVEARSKCSSRPFTLSAWLREVWRLDLSAPLGLLHRAQN